MNATILTITMNPCIDISAQIPLLVPDKKLHCTHMKKEPGGGGINVSRVIARFGGNTNAIFPAGGYTGEFFVSMLVNEEVPVTNISIEQHTRENMVVLEEKSGMQYRFGMPGPQLSEAEWKECLQKVKQAENVNYIVASGSLANAVPEDFFARLAVIAKQKQARLLLDTSGLPLKFALEEGVYLVKPNLGELASLVDTIELNIETAITAAREIIARQQAEVVVVSMGASGALLVTAAESVHFTAPVVKIRSVVGAGDSMVAGIVYSLNNGDNIKNAVRFGVACGTAATMNEGTALCRRTDVDYLIPLIKEVN